MKIRLYAGGYASARFPAWSDAERALLRDNINKVSYAHLATLLPGRSVDSIKRRADLIGAPRRGKMGQPPRRTLNENYFSDRSLQSAYWAGFIAADGCIVTHPRQEVRIGIHVRDEAQLRRFVTDSGFDGPITRRKDICYVTICAAGKWIKDLQSIYHIGPRKTFSLIPPSVRDGLALAYSIGYIDGDGCWATNVSTNGSRYRMLVVVGTKPVLDWLRQIWTTAGAEVGPSEPRPSRGCWRLSIAGSRAASVATLLDVISVVKFERKWRVARGEATHQAKKERRLEQ